MIASAFALADEELAKIEQEAVCTAEELAANPPPHDRRAEWIAAAAERLREVAHEAADDGVRFNLTKPKDEPPVE